MLVSAHAQVKAEMLCQLLTLASITPYDREAHKHEARRREQQRYERLARGEPAAKQVLRSRLGEVAGMAMSLDAHRAVAEMDAEASKSGAFRRVYPTANGHVHRHIFAQERPLNTMLCEVLRQRAADVANAAEHDLDAISGAAPAEHDLDAISGAARGAAHPSEVVTTAGGYNARPSKGVPPTDPADAPGSAPTTELADAPSAIAQAPPKAATRLAEALGEGQQQQQQKPPQPTQPTQPSQQPQQPQQPQPQPVQQPQAQPHLQSPVPSRPARIAVQAHDGSPPAGSRATPFSTTGVKSH